MGDHEDSRTPQIEKPEKPKPDVTIAPAWGGDALTFNTQKEQTGYSIQQNGRKQYRSARGLGTKK